MPDPPRHISHSARETLEKCPKSYYLAKIARAPRRPAVWLAGGSGVHEVTEAYDRAVLAGEGDDFPLGYVWDSLFNAQLDTLRETEPNESVWRRSKTEGPAEWRGLGPDLVRAYIEWRERSPWVIWTTPDGEPAIELDVSGRLPGCPVEIKAYLDRVFHDPVFDRLWVFDLKTGRTPPATPDQFRTYAALLRVKYGAAASHGVAFMNRKGIPGKPWDLSDATPEAVGRLYGAAWKQIQSGHFPAKVSSSCGFICDVEAACAARNGPLAHLYDPDHPGFRPPF